MDLKINAVCTLSFAGSGPLWFLPTLFISELLFVLILKKLGKKNGIICSLVVSAVGFTAWYFVEPVYTVAKNILLYFFLINIPFVVIRSMMCLVFLALASLVYTYLQKPAAFSLKELLAGLAFFIINIPVSLLNSNIDMHNMDYGKIYLFIPCAFLGSIGLILICRNIPAIKIIEFYGRNSLIIMATHLNFYILYLGGVVAFALNPYITRAKEYVFLFNILLTTMIVETILILIINRFLPWMIGKQYNRNKK